jgi:hypothetical protein
MLDACPVIDRAPVTRVEGGILDFSTREKYSTDEPMSVKEVDVK